MNISFYKVFIYQLITKVTLNLSSITSGSGLEFWSVKYTSIKEKSETNVFNYIKIAGKTSNWANDLFGEHEYRALAFL